MGCVSLPNAFLLQTPVVGRVFNVTQKKQQGWVSVRRRPFHVTTSVSSTKIDNMIVKEDSEFKSTFDDYLKAMESIKAEREKKLKEVAAVKPVLQNRKREEAAKNKRSKGPESMEEDGFNEGSHRGSRKGKLSGSVLGRHGVRLHKESNYDGSKDVEASKNVRQNWKREEIYRITKFKGLDSEEKDDFNERSHRVARKERLGGSAQGRIGVRLSRELNCSGSKDVAVTKNVLQNQKHEETARVKRFQGSDSKEENNFNERSPRATSKGRLGSNFQERTSVRLGKELNHVGLKHVAASENVRQNWKRAEADEFKRFKGSDSKEETDFNEQYNRVPSKERLGGNVRERSGVRLRKEFSYVGSKDVPYDNSSVDTAAATSVERVQEKRMSANGASTRNELDIERYFFQPPEFLDDGLDAPRVTRMEMENRIQELARRLNEADMDMPEWIFSKSMRSARIRFCDHSIMRVIQVLGKLGNWRRVLQVIEWLQMHERFKSLKIRHVYTAALGVLGKARRPVEALNMFHAMQRHKSLYPDTVAYHSIAVTLGQAGHMKELFDVMDSMRSMPKTFKIEASEDWDPRREPDVVVYNAVLNACVKRKEWEGSLWVLQKMSETGQQPSSSTYGLVMEVMLVCGKYDMVHEYYRQLRQFFAPNTLTYRVLVNTLWREGKPDDAIAAVQDMEKRGLVGSASLYYDLARCLCSAGRYEEALMQVDKICKVASKPLVVTYTGLIQACVDSAKVHDGASIFNHMQKYCSPNSVTCNIMLKAYLANGMFSEAKELFQKMTQRGDRSKNSAGRIKPDIHTFNLMLEACIREERWDDFDYAYNQMFQHRHPFNTKRHLWMVRQASSAGKVAVIETTWAFLKQTNRIPPPGLIKEMFRLKLEKGEVEAAVSSVASHPSSHQQSFSREAWSKLFEDHGHCFQKEALEQLMREINVFTSKSESPNLIFQNLLDSCAEFVRDDKPVADRTHLTEIPVNV